MAHAQTSLSGQLDAARLVDVAAQRMGIRVSYDEAALKGVKTTLRQEAPLSDGELWQLANRVLADQGWTTIVAADDGTVSVVKVQAAQQLAKIEDVDLGEPRDAGEGYLPTRMIGAAGTTVGPGFRRVMIRPQRASTKDIVGAAQLLLSKSGGDVKEFEGGGMIVLGDFAPSLETTLRALAQMDSGEAGTAAREVVVKNVEPARAATLAKQLADKSKAAGARELRGEVLAGVSGGSSVVVVAPQASMAGWEAIIGLVDQREPTERRVYSVSAFGLKEVAGLIEQSVHERAAGGPGPTGSPAVGAGADDRWKLITDDLTGSLIIDATPAQHERITELIDRLSAVPTEARRPVRTFKIKNRPVKEMQAILQDLATSGVLDSLGEQEVVAGSAGVPASATMQTTPRPLIPGGTLVPTTPGAPMGENIATSGLAEGARPYGVGSSGAGTTSSPRDARSGRRSDSLRLTADESTNTLIAMGDPQTLARIEHLLPTLDVRQPQVLLEAYLISLSDSDSLDLGVELEKIIINGDTLIRLSSLFGLSSAVAGGLTRSVPERAGFTGSVLNPGDFSIVIRALEAISKGRSLSSPKVLVGNNQQATFNSVLQIPFASTNASTTVATTAFGGTQDAGTTITVKPQIAEGDHLVLDYSVSLSSFVGSGSAVLPPPRQQNSVQSMATIPDGHTVVVGGLELTTEGNATSQVPILGDIPIVGEAFKNRSKTRSRSRFFVFLRANVLRSGTLEDLKYVSERDVAATGVPAGWPEVEPRMIK